MSTVTRLFFLDNLRVVAMMLVIAHHAGQPYGPTGGWWPISETARADVLGPFFMVNRSFGMSLFFMIAGYFTVMSCDKSGPWPFLKSRLLRLGVPLLWFTLGMILLQVFVFGAKDGQLGSAWPVDVGHMWFVQHLLLYSAVYAAWRAARGRDAGAPLTVADPPGYRAILAFAFGLAVCTAVVRTWFPIDHWDYLLGYFRVAFADVPRDLGMFIVGMAAYRHQWFTRFPARAGMTWLGVGLLLAAYWYAFDLWLVKIVPVQEPWRGAMVAIWESVFCLGMCIGLTVLFRERLNVQTALTRWMAQGQYAAYIFHVFVVLAFQAVLVGLP